MRLLLRHLALTAVLAAWAAPAAAAAGAPAVKLPLQWIDVIGRVTGPGGHGVEGVRVALDGSSDVSVETGEDGRYTLTVPLEPLGDPVRKNVAARIVARRAGWAFTLRNGQGALALELRVQTRTDPARCRVRSNVLASVDAVASAIRRGDRNAVIANADFVGEEGAPETRRVALRSEAVTLVGEANAPEMPLPVAEAAPGTNGHAEGAAPKPGASPSKPPVAAGGAEVPPGAADTVTPQADRRGASEPATSRTRVRRIEPQTAVRDTGGPVSPGSVKLPGPGVTQTDASLIRRIETSPAAPDLSGSRLRAEAVLAAEGECGCRIRGTVEIHPDHLLAKRLTLIVALREAPAVRDTIELFMGSPRPFELPALKCGTWHIEVDAVARRDFEVVSADGRGPIDCREGGLRQLRVVLDPR